MTWTTQQRSEVMGLSAIVAGQGRPVLLLHGVGLKAEAWAAQIAMLSTSFKVVAPDMYGHGESPCPSQPLAMEDYVLATLEVLAGFDQRALVAGHSMGAMIALELAFRAPEKISAVAALNAVFERSPEASAAVKARAGSLDGIAVPEPEPTLQRWFGTAPSPERAACETWLRAVDPMGYRWAYEAFAHATGPSRSALTGLQCPALFATGALERNSTPNMSRGMAALAPRGQAMIVQGAAHMMPMTHADKVNAALLHLAQEGWS
ncbi:alpha/beta hydrolase [Marivita sp. XM-24bin2]|uniref:alpha/beta fold hydrolase n=1 Tax=unclassified Marivita TaxID=2632480 RepID=UPI000D7A5304|nr:alpha/beta hydrolase [Marivita sp. XM-24bin2]MCR9111051.1 alpha/beta hydrolase [Paracoccaceae bacterium]PWL32695.1 MAG: alpha/beta hydrolase [Marivita sp. XM-24bin2]